MTVFLGITPLSLGLLALICVLALIDFLLNKRKSAKNFSGDTQFKTLPGPTGVPYLGYSYFIGRYKKHCDAFSDLRKRYGDIYGVKLGSRRCCVVSSMPYIREVLLTKSQDFANRPDFLRFHAIFRGNRNLSIALCDWSEKQKTRRDVTFCFMHPKMRTMDGSRMNKHIMSELGELITALSAVDGQVVNPRPYLLFSTANIFFQYLCSKRFDEEDKSFRNVVQIYDLVFRALFQGFAIDFMPWLKVFNRKKLQELQDNASTVSNIITPIFEEHEKVFDPEKPRDLIDILLEHLKSNEEPNTFSLTKEDAEVIIEDLLGGHSVLGNLWLWGLYLLAGNPEVRANIREEVLAITGNVRAPCIEDKLNMPYTEAATMELLRCISSPIIPHVATKDTSIQGYKVAKDTMVMFNTYDMNMDEQYWEEPRKFKPERFISEHGQVLKPSFFLPFGTGKRTCLGDGLVRATLFLGLSTLLQHFDICLPEGAPQPSLYDIPGIVIPQHDINLVFKKLDISKSSSTCTKISATP